MSRDHVVGYRYGIAIGNCSGLAVACGILGKWTACLVFTALAVGVFTFYALNYCGRENR